MDHITTYAAGKPRKRVNTDAILDTLADQILTDGDVEKAMQRAFRFGTDADIGLLDVMDRLREEIQEAERAYQDADQHTLEMEAGSAHRAAEDAVAMRDALRQVESIDDLQGIDPELMDRTLTSEELEWVDKWSDMTGQMIEAGLIAMSGPRLVLTAKAIRQIGSKLLQHMFLPPSTRGRGQHSLQLPGLHGTPGEETEAWEWGKPIDLHIGRSLANAVKRTHQRGALRLSTEDFEVFERESAAAIHTILLTDMSRSMFESGAWDAAKRAAISLNTLVATSRRHDHLDLVGFSGDARKLKIEELPALTWDQFSHGTNLHAGLLEASRLLRQSHTMNRQVVIITDGEPTAFMEGSQAIFEHPVTDRTIDATLLTARRMSRQGVSFTTVCVGDATPQPEFAQTLSQIVNGRLILLPLDKLGVFVVRDVARGTFLSVQ